MSTSTIEDTTVNTDTTSNDGDTDPYAHYFDKKDLDRALFEGVDIEALCGKVTRPLSGIQGRPECPTCRARLAEYPL